MEKFNKEVIDKWYPVASSYLNISNGNSHHQSGIGYLLSIFCHYMEYYSSNEDQVFFMNKLSSVKEKINKMDFKKKVKSEYINILTGKKEYLLEDGKFFDEDYKISEEFLIEIFGEEFMSFFDKSINIDIKIQKIIDGRIN